MSNNIKTQIGKVIGETLNSYHSKVKPIIDDLKFRQEYQDRIIECMVGEVDDSYIETPETNEPIVKLEHSKEGLVKVPSIKGKTILVDADGNETDIPAEGCRLVSVGEDEDNKLIILSKNKNLFTNVKTGKYYGGDGVLVSEPDSSYSEDYIKVKTGEVFIGNHLNSSIQIMEYDINKNLIQRVNQIPTVYIVPNKVEFIRLSFYRLNTILNNEFQFERGNTRTTYVEPKHYKTEILLNEPLHRGNSIDNNRLIKSFNKIFSDKEKWIKLNADLENTILFELYIRDAKNATSNHELANIVCNRFNTRLASNANGTWGTDIEGISVNTNGSIHLRIFKNRLTSLDNNGLMEWFKENLTEVIYELAEPIIEELPNSITLQGFDDTTMYIENSITPTVSYGYNALIPYKNELSQQKEEVEINTLDIENNIIPYLMDMEFNLITMEDK